MQFNYNVKTVDPSAYFRGLKMYDERQDSQLAQQQQQQQQAQQQQVQDLTKRAMQGDKQAFNQLASIDPSTAAQIQKIQEGQKAPKPAQVDFSALGGELGQIKQLAANGSPMLGSALQNLSTKYKGTGFDQEIAGWAGKYQQDPAAAIQELDASISAFNQPKESEKFAPEVSPIQTDPDTGQQYVIVTDRNTNQANRVDVKGGKARTGEQKVDLEINKELRKQGIEMSKQAFEDLKPVRSQISNYNEAIKALDSGAQSGAIDRFLPSFQESTIRLENAARRLGLDVISATTFGALSEGELRLAMDTAVPMNLPPAELKRWLKDAKAAKQKLAQELFKMGTTLGKGKMTPAEYMEKVGYQEAKRQEPSQQKTEQQNQQGGTVNWTDL